jgi:hypothetical protein
MHRQSWLMLRRVCGGWLLAVAVFGTAAQAQLAVGDDVKMTLNGYLGMGYSGDYGENGVSGHGLFGSGSGQLSGYYYHPNFLSFNVRPFYNRNQDNSSFASILSETGIDASTNLFGGTHFPGSMSFSKTFANGTQYGIPGSAGLSSDSSTRNFSVSWSELVPTLPTLTATFTDNSSSSTIQGEPGTTDSASRTINLISTYKVDGWGLNGFVNHQTVQVTLPAFLSLTNARSDSSGTAYGIAANHPLPLSGMFTAGYNRTDYSTETGSYRNNGSTDMAESTIAFKPTEKFSINGQVRYTGNLIGALQQSLPGGGPPLPTNERGSHGISLGTYGSYNLGRGFILVGYANRQVSTFEGIQTTSTQAGGTLTYRYARPLFGLLYFSFGMVNNAANNGGGSLGFVGNVSLKKRISGWEVESDFSYAQNVQTIIASYTTSNYSYGAALRRRFGANSYWSGSYRGLQSGLTQFAGYGNRSDSFVTIFHRGRYGLSGSYSQSHGTALLRTAGTLTPTQLAPLLQPDQTVYDGKVYGAGVNVIPLKKMLINVNWYRMRSDTLTAQTFSNNNSERFYGQMQYNLRKLSFRAGYWRVYQGISANGRPPSMDNTYYFNISRWFDIF